MLNYLAIETDNCLHNRESAAWASRNIGSVRAESMDDGIKRATGNKFLFILINAANINYMPKLALLREVTDSPILIATTNYTMREHANAMSLGADLFVQISDNACENIELTATLLAKLKERTSQRKESVDLICCGNILVAREHRKVFIGEKAIPLNRDETNILYYLLCNSGRVLSYEQIYNYTRGDDSERLSFNAVRCAVKRLRRKIEDAGEDRSVVENIRGIGYRISTKKDGTPV